MRRQGGRYALPLATAAAYGAGDGQAAFPASGRTDCRAAASKCLHRGGVVILLKYGHILPHFSRTGKAANCGKKEHSHTTRVAKFRFSIETRVSMCYVLTEAAVYGRENEC